MTGEPRQPNIVGIDVDDLFGSYSYKLRPNDANQPHQLLLLYGDNGAGKSTISQLLFHSLSRDKGRGHRTFLAETMFRRFAVHFSSGTTFTAIREKNELVGPYALIGKSEDGQERRADVTTQEDGSVRDENISDEALGAVLDICLPHPQRTYFLSDERVLTSDEFSDDLRSQYEHEMMLVEKRGRLIERRVSKETNVDASVSRAERWLKEQAYSASDRGEESTAAVYQEIVGRIAKAPVEAKGESSSCISEIVEKFASIEKRSIQFRRFGLSHAEGLGTLHEQLINLPANKHELVSSVLEPYAASLNSKLDANEITKQRLETFLDIANDFYKRKTVEITVSGGIRVIGDDGRLLKIRLLSSGEKQLMLLLCNILCATNHPSLFIVDEPEISLNVKWQRKLVSPLLRLCDRSDVQFIMATHSIEVLSEHNDSVMKLEDQNKSNG